MIPEEVNGRIKTLEWKKEKRRNPLEWTWTCFSLLQDYLPKFASSQQPAWDQNVSPNYLATMWRTHVSITEIGRDGMRPLIYKPCQCWLTLLVTGNFTSNIEVSRLWFEVALAFLAVSELAFSPSFSLIRVTQFAEGGLNTWLGAYHLWILPLLITRLVRFYLRSSLQLHFQDKWGVCKREVCRLWWKLPSPISKLYLAEGGLCTLKTFFEVHKPLSAIYKPFVLPSRFHSAKLCGKGRTWCEYMKVITSIKCSKFFNSAQFERPSNLPASFTRYPVAMTTSKQMYILARTSH